MNNYLKALLKYARFRIKYPKTPFVQPSKTIGTLGSQDGQDIYMVPILHKLFEKKIAPQIIVDAGANHPEKFSNTLFFEKWFGCRTIAVDPLIEYEALWRQRRPAARFHNVALGGQEGVTVLNIPLGSDDMFSSVNGARGKKAYLQSVAQRTVKVSTLNTILAEECITDVAMLSVDVEGFELEVLKGINFEKVKIHTLLIENNDDGYFGRDEIREYMAAKGYTYIARIGWLDDVFVLSTTYDRLNALEDNPLARNVSL